MRIKSLAAAIAALCAQPTFAAGADDIATEFFHGELQHYFLTTNAAEASMIENGGAGPGWVRTGRTFAVWSRASDVPGVAVAVRRFYSSQANSHFFTASAGEAAQLQQIERAEKSVGTNSFRGWSDEGPAFFVAAASGSNSCPTSTVAVRRLYNDGFRNGDGSNHRFVVDDSVHSSMEESRWIAEGIAFCSDDSKKSPPAPAPVVATVGAYSGVVIFKAEIAGTPETKTALPFSLSVAADGMISGQGAGCALSGSTRVAGDSIRSGTATVSGCADGRFNGVYSRLTIEQQSAGAIAIRFRQGDNNNERTISGTLSNGTAVISPTASPTPSPTASPSPSPSPTPSPGTPGVGTFSGTASWETRTRDASGSGGSEVLVAVAQPLRLTVAASGITTGGGYGCVASGTVSVTNVTLGTRTGTLTLTGCTNAAFNGSFLTTISPENNGAIEAELERTPEGNPRVNVKGRLSASGTGVTPTPAPTPGPTAAPTPSPTPSPTAGPTPAPTPSPTASPTPSPSPSPGLAASYSGTGVWEKRVRAAGASGSSETVASTTAPLRLVIANDGTVTAGGGNGCSASGKLSVSNAATGALSGTITLSGCTDPAFSGGYAARATAENGGALEVEMEREVETAGVNTKTKVKGRLARG